MKRLLLIMMIAFLTCPALAADPVTSGSSPQMSTPSTTVTAIDHAPIRPVESKYICMVTNKVFDKPQIPVEIGEKTYYGCCEMCKSRLENDSQVRLGIDPVSGKSVDKSSAVIGAGDDGSVYYFENEENLKNFNKGERQ